MHQESRSSLVTIISTCCALAFLLVLSGCSSIPATPGLMKEKGGVYLGADILEENGFQELRGKKVGLITNHTGLTRNNVSTIDLLYEAPDVELVALFGPEHGLRGTADEKVSDGRDEKTGLPIYSLYGENRKPSPEMLEGIDVLVFDIQDIGTRFYTYIATMAMGMEACKEQGIEFVVLDRPNPINGINVEGVVAEENITGGFTAIYPIPTRHGMTVGELSLLFNDHFDIGCDLTVIPMRGWERWMYWDETGILWENPSPNMKTLAGAILYPGLGAAETTWISCGRGTDRPFEMYGAPYMDGEKLAKAMNEKNLPGLRFVPYTFTPTAKWHKHQGERCEGIFVVIYDRDKLDVIRTGLHMVQTMEEFFAPDYKALGGFKTLFGSDKIWAMLTEEGKTPEEVIEYFQPSLDEFKVLRKEYLLY